MTLFETAKEHCTDPRKWYDHLKKVGATTSFENDDLCIYIGDEVYTIEDCKERCIDLYEQEIYEICCKYDYHPGPDYYRTQAEKDLDKGFNALDFAAKNVGEWKRQ